MSLNFRGECSRKRFFDVSEYDTIAFEEILLYNPNLLSPIHRFMKLHTNKKNYCKWRYISKFTNII